MKQLKMDSGRSGIPIYAYREKFGIDVYSDEEYTGVAGSYTDEYVHWLEDEYMKHYYTMRMNYGRS